MEMEESETQQGCKHPVRKGDEQYQDEEEDGDVKRRSNDGGSGGRGGGGGGGFDFNRLCGWPSSRIVRVSRASGGKDRHSKVLTSKGLRDRRVRLSVNTAIQFYDLQDRLGYDQPSKAVEWLLQAAASSITELPTINTSFPDITTTTTQQQPHHHHHHHHHNQQLGDERRSLAAVEINASFDPNYQLQGQEHQSGALSKSNSCSTSETSKGSGLSLSRSDIRIKRERAADKEAGNENEEEQMRQNLNPISQSASSFTELLTNGMGGANTNTNGLVHHQNHSGVEANFFNRSPRQWSSSAPMDYFASEQLGPASTRASHGFPGQIQFGENYQEMQPFAFLSDHFVPLVTVAGGNNDNNNNNSNSNSNAYNLNFTISSASSSSPGVAGFNNRGTLQSNSSIPQLQRFSSTDGSSPSPFFISATQPHNGPVENHHHHFLTGFDARLQLCYGDGRHNDDYKGKGKG